MRTLIALSTLALVSAAGFAQERQSAAPAPRLLRLANIFKPVNEMTASPVESVTVSVYDGEHGGAPLWTETQNVNVDAEGRYSVLVGATLPDGLPLDLFAADQARWLGVKFNRPSEVEQPRVLLVSVPYALKARDAETLGGLPPSAYLLAAEDDKEAGIRSPSASRGYVRAVNSVKAAPRATSGNVGYIAQFVNATDLGNSLLFQSGTNIGVGVTNPSFALDLFSAVAGPSAALRVGNGTWDNRLRVESNQPYALGMKNGVGGTYAWMGVTSGGNYQFSDQVGAPLLTIQQGGNVGIGTTFPASKLDVTGDINLSGGLRYQGAPLLQVSGTGLNGFNFAAGPSALANTSNTAQNVAVGPQALFLDGAGVQNTAVGFQALYANTSGNGNTAMGPSALRNNAVGSYSVAIGYGVLMNNTASYNTGLGALALLQNTNGFNNTAVGADALRNNTIGNSNTATGSAALQNNTLGSDNTATGSGALIANTTGSHNTASGSGALYLNTSGDNNTAAGYNALAMNSTGSANTAYGYFALQLNDTGFLNAAAGAFALQSNSTGYENTANGAAALQHNTSGFSNTADGYLALGVNTTGSNNTAQGQLALGSNTNGNFNTASGYYALVNNTTGVQNVALGADALPSLTTGSGNIAIGYFAAANLSAGASNNIHIGSRGAGSDSAAIRIGTPGTQASFFAAGVRGVATGFPDAVSVVIDSAGQLGTVSSSRRFKEDIHDMAGASLGLLSLRPVTFRYKQPYADGSKPIQYGLIAEEVAEVYPDLVARSSDGQIETVKYQVLDAMLLNEVQRQEHRIDQQAELIRRQQAAIDLLLERVRKLESGATGADSPAGQR